jgi:energy-coupling factor transporter ATP-binding protein EcfA2
VLKLLELENIANQIIGIVGQGGLSVEQRKRVTIGVELVANPSIIFLDEPTSGLDSRAAAVVMRAVRNVARTNRTVVCTIHQPSSYLFEMFDSLLLLKKGGRSVYFGPLGTESSNLINHMQSMPGAQAITVGANPATYMLEVIGAGTTGQTTLTVDPADFFQESSLAQENMRVLAAIESEQKEILKFTRVYAASLRTQMKALLIKAFKGNWRSPNYNLTRMMIIILVGFIFGSVYVRSEMKTQRDVISRFSVMLIAAIFSVSTSLLFSQLRYLAIIATTSHCFRTETNPVCPSLFLYPQSVIYMNSVLETVQTERAVFYRERAANMYSTLPYSLSFTIAEIPYLLVNTFMFSIVFYFTVGLEQSLSKFLWFWLYYFFMLWMALQAGQLVSS